MLVSQYKVILLVILLGSVEIVGKRGGGGGFGRGAGSSRGASAARASSASRGGSGGGGLFGGGGGAKSSSGTGGHGGGLFGGGSKSHVGSGQHNRGGSGWGGGGGGGYRTSTFSNGNGIGSKSRSSTFKNMIVGAAAGVLAYQAGKAIIRSVAAPMSYGGRNYYWGSQYYPSSAASGRQMCRMPVEPSDPQFGNIYMPGGQERPKEIVWSCNYHEQCCGYDCCPSSHGSGGYGGGGYGWNSRPGLGLGSIVLIILLCCCCIFATKWIYDKKRENEARGGGGEQNIENKYQPGNVSYTAADVPPNNVGGPPPPYPVNNGFLYTSA